VIKGLGERHLAGVIDRCGDGGAFTVALVAGLLRAGFFLLCGAAFCSNIPIKDVVGGIEMVSRT
jgi:hypothetical protein